MNGLIWIDVTGENECKRPRVMNNQMQQKQQQPKSLKKRIKRIIAHTTKNGLKREKENQKIIYA